MVCITVARRVWRRDAIEVFKEQKFFQLSFAYGALMVVTLALEPFFHLSKDISSLIHSTFLASLMLNYHGLAAGTFLKEAMT